jgi:hypothetical protein
MSRTPSCDVDHKTFGNRHCAHCCSACLFGAQVVRRPPHRPRVRDYRIMVGALLAGLFREGTIIRDRKGQLWRSWRDHEYDTWPLWEPMPTSPDSETADL